MSETYQQSVMCSNCSHFQNYDVPKGTTIEEFLAGKICDKCGCPLDGSKKNIAASDKGRVAGL